MMSRRFTIVTVSLAAVVAFLVGVIVAGGFRHPEISAGAPARRADTPAARRATTAPVPATLVNFADVVEQINPAVVNIDASTRGASAGERRRRRSSGTFPDPPDLFQRPDPNSRGDAPRRGTGSGFII